MPVPVPVPVSQVLLRQNDFLQWSELEQKEIVKNDYMLTDQIGRRLYDVMERGAFLRRERGANRLRQYSLDNAYVFSRHGHGRTGLFGGCMMGRLYGLAPHVVIERGQRCHDTRVSMDSRDPSALPISTPTMPSQTRQVKHVLSLTEPIYGTLDRRDDDDFLVVREQARGKGCRVEPDPPKYSSSSLRVQAMMDGVPLDILKESSGVGRQRKFHSEYEKVRERKYQKRVIEPIMAARRDAAKNVKKSTLLVKK